DIWDAEYFPGGWPRHLIGLRAGWMPLPKWTIDGFLRYVDTQSAIPTPTYTELNARVAWRALPSLELAIVGENLLHAKHAEDSPGIDVNGLSAQSLLERSVTLEFTWSWQ